MNNIHIANQHTLDSKINLLHQDGVEHIHVLADFDNTITKAYVNAERIQSIISLLRVDNSLSNEYTTRAQEIAEEALEKLTNAQNLSERTQINNEWWRKHYELLLDSRLNINDIKNVIQSNKIQLRDGFTNFVKIINSCHIPIVIISATGLGTEAISGILQRNNIDLNNIFIVSNQIVWDKNGYMKNYKKSLIHSSNKDETILNKFSFYAKIKNRKNVILLGDSPDDALMIKGFNSKVLLSVGFLNSHFEKDMEKYKKTFDLVISGDGSFIEINQLLNKIILGI